MSVYQRLLGTPFVYNHIRPLAVGGLDMSPFYRRLETDADSVVLDVGCGTGDALRYLDTYRHYTGVDTDPVAIRFAESRHGRRPGVTFECAHLTEERFRNLRPTHVLMAGLLHHLDDSEARSLLEVAARVPDVTRVVTCDIVFLRGKPISNWLARMDRGQYCRRQEAYEALARQSGLTVCDSSIVRCHPRTGLAWYLMMTLQPAGTAQAGSTAPVGGYDEEAP